VFEYSLIEKGGGYYLVQTKCPQVCAWGVGGHVSRREALKQAREYCAARIAHLNDDTLRRGRK